MPIKSRPFRKNSTSQQAQNPFQEKWAKSNQTLLRKRSQTAAFAKQSRQNVFSDRRIGEDDPTLDDENRYLYRLQRERTKRVRKRARFSLADDDTQDDDLGGGSQEFPSLQREEDVLVLDENEDSAHESEDGEELMKLKQSNYEGQEDKGERTRQEIMEEVVQKSKMYKAQRQHEKFVTDEQTAKLDNELPNLMQMLAESGAENVKKQPKLSLTLKTEPQTKVIFEKNDTPSVPAAADQKFHYDDVYRQLANEKRARPSERLLTEEEKAERERDRLVELEMQRKSRMEFMDDSDEESEAKGKAKRGAKLKREKGPDDLDDDFDVPDLGETSASGEDIASDGDDDGELSDKGQIEEGKEASTETPESFWQAVDQESFPALLDGGVKDIPFVFKKCPSNSVELQWLLNGMTIDQRSLVLDRIQKCFAESLNPARNRPMLEKLVECILFRVERLTELEGDNLKSGIAETDMLLAYLYKMGQKFEPTISAWSRRKLLKFHSKLGASNTNLCSAWTTSDVMIARAIGRLYPSSDIRHPVVTPLALLLSEALSIRRMSSIADVALGIFVANVLLEVMSGREGYSGELCKFVREIFFALCKESKRTNPWKLKSVFKELVSEAGEEQSTPPLSLKDCIQQRENGDVRGDAYMQRKVAYAAVAVAEAMNFSGRNRNWDVMLSGLPIEKLALPETRDRLLKLISQSRDNRTPLALYTASRKRILKALNPKYSAESGAYRKRPKTSFQSRMQGDTSASANRVKRALRKEQRALARDVRREAEILAASRAHEQHLTNEDRDRRHREVMSFFERQQATWKAAEKRQKKLSGKKW